MSENQENVTTRMLPVAAVISREKCEPLIRTHIAFNMLVQYYGLLFRRIEGRKPPNAPPESSAQPDLRGFPLHIRRILKNPEALNSLQKLVVAIATGKCRNNAREAYAALVSDKKIDEGGKKWENRPELKTLRDYGLLGGAIFHPVTTLLGLEGHVYEIGQAAFASAAERTSSQRGLQNIRKGERERQESDIEKRYSKIYETEGWTALDEIEKELTEYYESPYGYKVTGRRIKGWPAIRAAWVKHLESKAETTDAALEGIQTKKQHGNPRNFGDAKLFELLRKPENWAAWYDADAEDGADIRHDLVSLRAQYNKDARRKKGHGYSYADPLRHPVWITAGLKGGSNRIGYTNLMPGQHINVQTLVKEGERHVKWEHNAFPLTYSKRIERHSDDENIARPNGKMKLHGQEVRFKINSTKIIFDRDMLEKCSARLDKKARQMLLEMTPAHDFRQRLDYLTNAIVKTLPETVRVQFAMSVEINQKDLEERLQSGKDKQNLMSFIKDDKEQDKSKEKDYLGVKAGEDLRKLAGIRVLAIDLGMRHSAAFAVLEVRKSKPRRVDTGRNRTAIKLGKIYLTVKDTGFINVPGDSAKRCPELERLRNAVNDGHTALTVWSNLLSTINADNPLQEIRDQITDTFGVKTDRLRVPGLLRIVEEKIDESRKAIHESLHLRTANHGISLRRISILDNYERYERRYAGRPYIDSDGVVQQRKKRSAGMKHIKRIRENINLLKRERGRKIPAAIIQKAIEMGCQAIAMEDLLLYKFDEARTRFENRKLMEWCHREIYDGVRNNVTVHGLIVARVKAGYTSRFDALTGSPGMRFYPKNKLKDRVPDPELDQSGKLRSSGSHLLTLHGEGCRTNNADINAAINVGKRFFKYVPIYIRATKSGDRFVVTSPTEYKGKVLAEKNGAYRLTEAKLKGSALKDMPDIGEKKTHEKTMRLLRDPTGQIAHKDAWVEYEEYWRRVREKIVERGAFWLDDNQERS